MSQEIIDKFKIYHAENPQVWEKFEEMALKSARKRVHFGSRAILELIRWFTAVEGNDGFKVNNNYAAYYARLFEHRHPEHKGYFRKRSIK